MQELKKKIHEEMKMEAESFMKHPSRAGLESLYMMMQCLSMMDDVKEAHEAMPTGEKPKGLWG